MQSTPEMVKRDSNQEHDSVAGRTKKEWQAPEITSITSVLNTQGIAYNPTDGISNLTP